MATSVSETKRSYPLMAYNYRVTFLVGNVEGLMPSTPLRAVARKPLAAIGGPDSLPSSKLSLGSTVINCNTVTGLTMEREHVVYKHGLSFIMGDNIIPGQRKEVRLTLKRGVATRSSEFADWMGWLYPIVLPTPKKVVSKRDIVIDLCDEEGLPAVRWVVLKAMPVKLSAPNFDASTSEVAMEELDLIGSQLMVDFNP